ncbi:MAG: hypothetical protein NW205_09085 [Hyphomicrobiaceae bacterium]|nr:hypothetical protein [Hyphomicrobiaceae bacterium]
MTLRTPAAAALILAAALAGGCANDGSLALTTGSLSSTAAETPRVDPACVALMARIEELRKEGTPARLQEVATGKTKTVSVKRESLARMTDLDKANAEFQSKCSTLASPAAARPAAAAAAATASPVGAAPPAGAGAPTTVAAAPKPSPGTPAPAPTEP